MVEGAEVLNVKKMGITQKDGIKIQIQDVWTRHWPEKPDLQDTGGENPSEYKHILPHRSPYSLEAMGPSPRQQGKQWDGWVKNSRYTPDICHLDDLDFMAS